MSTTAHFFWNHGIEFQKLITILEAFYPRDQYRYSDYFSEGYGLTYREPDGMLFCTIVSPLINYRLDPFRIERLDWRLFKKSDMGRGWLSFGLMYGQGPDDIYNSFREGKVVRLRCEFDHLLWPATMGDDNFEKYQQLKQLFEILDADLLDGIYDSDVTIWHESDPEHRGRILRFSKEGPQLIVPDYEKDAHQLDLQPRPEGHGIADYVSRIDRPWASAFAPRQN